MKNRPSRHRYNAPSGTRKAHGSEPAEATVLVVPRPEPELAKAEGASEHIQRWEDDGGPVAEAPNPLPQLAETKTIRPWDVAGYHAPYDES